MPIKSEGKNLSSEQLFSFLETETYIDFRKHNVRTAELVGIIKLALENSTGKIEERIEFPSFPRGVIGMMVPRTSYWISVDKAALTAACVLVDIFITLGLVSAAAGMVGEAGQSIVRVSDRNGEICVIQSFSELNQPLIQISEFSKSATHNLSSKECRNPEFPCIHRINSECKISEKQIIDNINRLTSCGIFRIDEADNIAIRR